MALRQLGATHTNTSKASLIPYCIFSYSTIMVFLEALLNLVLENTTVVLIFLIVFLVAYRYTGLPAALPPGPWGLPFIGNFSFLLRRISTQVPFERWHEKYGDIFTVWMGNQTTIVVGGVATIKDVFKKHGRKLEGRPEGQLSMEFMSQKNRGKSSCKRYKNVLLWLYLLQFFGQLLSLLLLLSAGYEFCQLLN